MLTFVAEPVLACYQGIEEACFSRELVFILVLSTVIFLTSFATSRKERNEHLTYNRWTVGVFAVSVAIVALRDHLPPRYAGPFYFLMWIISLGLHFEPEDMTYSILFGGDDMPVDPVTGATYLPYGSPFYIQFLVPMILPFLWFGFACCILVFLRSLVPPMNTRPGKPGKP